MKTTDAAKNNYLIKKVSMTDTVRNLPMGVPVTFDCREAGPMSSAQSAVSRLTAGGQGKWKVVSTDNGATYTITRTN